VKSLAWVAPRYWLPHRLVVPGVLELVDNRLRFTAVGPPPPRAKWDWLVERSGQPDVVERLEQGEAVSVLDVPVSSIEISFPRSEGGGQAKLEAGGGHWRVFFSSPVKTADATQKAIPYGPLAQAGAAIAQLPDLKRARQVGKEWRKALGV
jgi:hypothetical protein